MKKEHQQNLDEKNSGPLKNVRIIDMSSIIMGPYATQILGDLGADVIKVENIGGDIIRLGGQSPTPNMGPIYMRINRNKKSLELDLSKKSSKEALGKLIATADVFFTNIRLSGLEKLGLDYAGVKTLNPKIIYVHCIGFSPDGPYGGRQAFDDLVQAAAGLTELLPLVDGNPQPRYLPCLIADKTAGLHAVYATLAGLFHRERTGEGQFIDVPMFESFISFNMIENMYGNTFVPTLGPTVYPRSIEPNRKPYATKDGYIAIVPYSDADWSKFFKLAGRSDVMDDPRFATFTDRTVNISLLYGKIGEVTKEKTTEEWENLLNKNNIPCMRDKKLSEVTEDEHLKAIGFFEQREHATEGKYVSMKHPVHFEKTPTSIRYDPPKVGQDNREILEQLGYNEEQIQEMSIKAGQ